VTETTAGESQHPGLICSARCGFTMTVDKITTFDVPAEQAPQYDAELTCPECGDTLEEQFQYPVPRTVKVPAVGEDGGEVIVLVTPAEAAGVRTVTIGVLSGAPEQPQALFATLSEQQLRGWGRLDLEDIFHWFARGDR
jgi:hypothetical protein